MHSHVGRGNRGSTVEDGGLLRRAPDLHIKQRHSGLNRNIVQQDFHFSGHCFVDVEQAVLV